jgi:hypothetical protein
MNNLSRLEKEPNPPLALRGVVDPSRDKINRSEQEHGSKIAG